MNVTKILQPDAEPCGVPTTATLGTFDGVHIGHRVILKRLVEKARETDTESVVVTFDRHPLTVVNPGRAPKLLSTLNEKIAVFETFGIDHVIVLEFTEEISRMRAGEFLKRYLVDCLSLRNFVVGYDHHFGSDKVHTTDQLRDFETGYAISVEIVPPVLMGGVVVKSSLIRELIEGGDVERAAVLLDGGYSIAGTVVRGRGTGKQLGFPTANIEPVEPAKAIPRNGVYAGWVEFGESRFNAVITIGPRPTFNISQELIEVHVPDISHEFYDRDIRVGFSQRLRDIVKFETEEALAGQIRRDIEKTRQFINHNQ